MDNTITLHTGIEVPLPQIDKKRAQDLGEYVDFLQDTLPCKTLVKVQSWALAQSESYGGSVDYWCAIFVAAAAHEAHMDTASFQRCARSSPQLLHKYLC